MSEMKHTPEEIGLAYYTGYWEIVDADQKNILDEWVNPQASDTARRLIDCYKACAGIADPIAAMKEVGKVMYHLQKNADSIVQNPAYYKMLFDRLAEAGFKVNEPQSELWEDGE